MSKKNETLTFEDVRKAIDSQKRIIEDAEAKRIFMQTGIERQRAEMVLVDKNIFDAQSRLNDELTADGKANQKTLDTLAQLRRKHEDIETTIMSLKMEALPKIEEEIRVAQIELTKAFEVVVDELRPFYIARINGRFAAIDMDTEEWKSGVDSIVNEYNVDLNCNDKLRILRLKGIRLNGELLNRLM